MKTLVKWLVLLTLGTVICLPGGALAVTIGFDDVLGGVINDSALHLPTNYAGFTWSSTSDGGYWGVIDNTFYRSSNAVTHNQFDFPSNQNVVINESGPNAPALNVAISRSTPFNLVSAYFSPWTTNDTTATYGAATVTLTGYLSNVQVGPPLVFSLTAGQLQLQSIGFNNIDKVTFDAGGGGQSYFLMDNMVTNPVPLPPTALLLGSGLLGLLGLGWRRAADKS